MKVAPAYKGEFDLESSILMAEPLRRAEGGGVEESKLENLCQVRVKSNLLRTDSW